MKYKLQHYETGEIVNLTLTEVLDEINRDRSEYWTDYDESDWRDGLALTDWSEVE